MGVAYHRWDVLGGGVEGDGIYDGAVDHVASPPHPHPVRVRCTCSVPGLYKETVAYASVAGGGTFRRAMAVLLPNSRNSCFADAVLTALLLVPTPFVDGWMLRCTDTDEDGSGVPRTVLEIARGLRGDGTRTTSTDMVRAVATLRVALGSTGRYAQFGDGRQHDASEFLYALLGALGLDTGPGHRRVVVAGYGNRGGADGPGDMQRPVVTTDRVEPTGPVVHAAAWCASSPFSLCSTEDAVLDVPCTTPRGTFARMSTTVHAMPGEFFVVHVDRSARARHQTPFPVAHAPAWGGRSYRLVSAVLWAGRFPDSGHYTCLVDVRARTPGGVPAWTHYDGIGPTARPVGPEEARDVASKSAVLLFYGAVREGTGAGPPNTPACRCGQFGPSPAGRAMGS